jgi:phosphoribosylaminoimidazole-succinocarboxamide synthase
MSDEWIDTISKRYIELYEKVTGKNFIPQQPSDDEIVRLVTASLERIGAI